MNLMIDEARLQKLQDTLNRIVAELTVHYLPQEIIVFGSVASGQVTENSDLDLLIVKDTPKRYWDRVREVVSLCDYDVGVDFLIYTPQELAAAAKDNYFVRDEILGKGTVVYRSVFSVSRSSRRV